MNTLPLPLGLPPKHLISGTFLQVSGQACEFCLQSPANKMHRCSCCRRAMYCNRTCQIRDWAAHKNVCSRLQLLDAAEAAESTPNGKLTPEEYGERQKARIALVTESGLGGAKGDSVSPDRAPKQT